MKLATLLMILQRFLNAFKNKEIYIINQTNNNVIHNYWDQECLAHPENSSYLMYCD